MCIMDKVDILLSIYDPNLNFLVKQLQSLNQQTYQNLELFVFDDCVINRTDREIIKKEITAFPVTFLSYEHHNLGYAKAFEKLIESSNGEYIAFCDQDDIWNNDKIEKCVNTLKKDNSLVVASDRTIIDENDNITISSVRKNSNKNYESWHTGDDIVKYNIFTTYAVGMCMVMDGKFARSILPISNFTGHDKWALCCAGIEGKISFIEEPLVQYRRHSNNVSGVLNGVNSKSEYYEKRVKNHQKIIEDLLKRYPNYKDKQEILEFSHGRLTKNRKILRKYRYLAPDIVKFEIVLSFVPGFLFKLLMYMARKIS